MSALKAGNKVMKPASHQDVRWRSGIAASLTSGFLLSAAAQTPIVPSQTNPAISTNLLLIDRFGNAVTAPTNEVSRSLYPSATNGLRNQIPKTPPGTPQPEAVRQRIVESKTARQWFPPTPPVLMPYLAGLNELGNTDFQPGALIPNDPLSRYPQDLKYWLNDSGIRYSFNQSLTMLSMSDVANGSGDLAYYTAALAGKWAGTEFPSEGRATWLSYQANIQLGLSPASRTQLPQSNLGVIASPNANIYGPNGIWLQELAVQQSLMDGKLVFLAGQVNQGNYLGANTYAGNSYGQFLNFAFCKDVVLPLPYNNLGLNLQYQATTNWYVMFGTGALNQSPGQSPFHDLSFQNWSYLFEFGLTPSDVLGLGPGVYRLQPFLATVDGLTQAGLGLNVQQRLGMDSPFGWFGRFGVGGSSVTVNGAAAEASTGLAWQGPLKSVGLFPGRSNDYLGAGVVWSKASANREPVFHSDEYGLETTYVLQLTPLVSVQPDFQAFWSPANNPAPRNFVFQLQLNVIW
jgi:porin